MKKPLFTWSLFMGLSLPGSLLAESVFVQPDFRKPMVIQQPTTPQQPESPGLWPMGPKEKERRPTLNQTVRGRAKLYPNEPPPRRIKLGDRAQ